MVKQRKMSSRSSSGIGGKAIFKRWCFSMKALHRYATVPPPPILPPLSLEILVWWFLVRGMKTLLVVFWTLLQGLLTNVPM